MPFKIINAINAGKVPDDISAYNPYITNINFSFFPDTLFFAQMMNMSYALEPKYQFAFLSAAIRPAKRWQKWLKKEKNDKYDVIRNHFQFSDQKTKEALAILSDEQIASITKLYE